MTLMDYCMQYIDEIMDGKRPAPEGITLTETDPVARGMELLQKVGDFPTLARLCAAQDGTQIPREVYDSFDPGAAISMFLGRDGEQESPQEPQPDPDAGKHAFQVLLDCVALDDGLVQYLTQVLRDRDWAGFYKLSQITTKMDLNPEEFLFWLGNKELWADDEERACAAVMDAVLLRLAEEGRLDAVAASGFSLSRGKAADLIASGRVQLNHRECVKPDHAVAQGDVLSCRGLGKCVLTEVGGPSKKGRILIVLERYV